MLFWWQWLIELLHKQDYRIRSYKHPGAKEKWKYGRLLEMDTYYVNAA